MRILVVEDRPDLRALLTELLEGAGYTVFSAANGLEALSYLRQSTDYPQLILLDLVMPLMTG